MDQNIPSEKILEYPLPLDRYPIPLMQPITHFQNVVYGIPYLSPTALIETSSYLSHSLLYSIIAERVMKNIKSNTES